MLLCVCHVFSLSLHVMSLIFSSSWACSLTIGLLLPFMYESSKSSYHASYERVHLSDWSDPKKKSSLDWNKNSDLLDLLRDPSHNCHFSSIWRGGGGTEVESKRRRCEHSKILLLSLFSNMAADFQTAYLCLCESSGPLQQDKMGC